MQAFFCAAGRLLVQCHEFLQAEVVLGHELRRRVTDYDAAAGGFSRPARNYGTGEIPLTMKFWDKEKRVPVRMNGSEPTC